MHIILTEEGELRTFMTDEDYDEIDSRLDRLEENGGSAGEAGADGFSPVAVVEQTDSGALITVTDKNGSTSARILHGKDGAAGADGPKGDTGPAGTDGYTPVRGTDYWTEADRETIVQQVIAALGTPVFGTVDEENNIILSGELADGVYTLKYEDAEGNVIEIGTLEHSTAAEPAYTNVLPQAIASDSTAYNGGLGWKTGYRLNSSGVESAADGMEVTGFIPVRQGDTVRFANIQWPVNSGVSANKCYVWLYKSDFGIPSLSGNDVGSHCGIREIDSHLPDLVGTDENNNLVSFTLNSETFTQVGNWDEIAYMRVSAYEISGDSVITVNQPID